MKKLSLLLCLSLCLSLLAGCQPSSASGVWDLFGQSAGTTGENLTELPQQTVTISAAEYESLQRFSKAAELLDMVSYFYYEEVDPEKLLDGAAQGLILALEDPYSVYYNPEDYAAMWEDDEGNYAGIGIQISGSYKTLECTISRVFTNSPAREAGLLKGDILIKVDDLAVNTYSLNDAVDIMRGEIGKTVDVTVLRGEEELTFTIPRAQVHVNQVEYTLLEEGLGYICLYEFAGDCRVKFAEAVNDLVSNQGAQRLILDLRDNPGGWVDDAEAIADMFLDEGIMYYLQYRQEDQKEYAYSKDGKVDVKMAVLINEFSASSSEILAGALQDRGAAQIVGVTSFGKGVVQYVLPLGQDGSGMAVTVAQYFTPNGNVVHKTGIVPDVEVPLPEGHNGMFEFADVASDVQLQKAIEVVKGM